METDFEEVEAVLEAKSLLLLEVELMETRCQIEGV